MRAVCTVTERKSERKERKMNQEIGLNQIGNRLSICRQNRGMTQDELAARIGVTPQALSKWERGLSLPDIPMVISLSRLFGVSTDYLLGMSMDAMPEQEAQEDDDDGSKLYPYFQLINPSTCELGHLLRKSLDALKLVFGKDVVPLYVDNSFCSKVDKLREELSWEGIWMPLLRLQDHTMLDDQEFMILSYQKVLYSERLETLDENTVDYMMQKLGQVVREKYYAILNPDIIKMLVDNLRIEYPALVEGVVPEKISYSLLTETAKKVLVHGDSICFLPKIIEVSDNALRRNPNADADELAAQVRNEIEGDDNFYVMMHNRKSNQG